MHQLKGSSASVGARQIAEACAHMRRLCEAQDPGGMRTLAGQMFQSFVVFKDNIGQLLEMRRKAR